MENDSVFLGTQDIINLPNQSIQEFNFFRLIMIYRKERKIEVSTGN